MSDGATRVSSQIQPRAYDPEDAPAVVRFLADTAADDPTIMAVTESEWKSFAARSFNLDARDFAVVEEAGRIIGLLTSTLLADHDPPLRHFRIVVHPAHRRRGIATGLLALVESQDANSVVVLQCNAMESWAAGGAFLERHGFRRVRRHLEMDRTGTLPPPAAPTSDVTIRTYRPNGGDDVAWCRLNAVGYQEDPDFQDLTAEDLALFRETAGFGLWFAELHENPVGLCHVELDGKGDGRVESVVVEHRARGRGIGRALLVTGLRALDERGIDRITLGVAADNAAAVNLYRSLGFGVSEEVVTWWRNPLPAKSVQRSFASIALVATLIGPTSGWSQVESWCSGFSASAVNEAGQVVGSGGLNQDRGVRAILWGEDGARDLGALPSGTIRPKSLAWAINDQAQVVGESRVGEREIQGFLWDQGVMHPIPLLDAALDIDSRGRVLGHRMVENRSVAVLWEQGEARDLETPGISFQPSAMNERGQVVGFTLTPEGRADAVLWENGEVRYLGDLGGMGSLAMDINDDGAIVGLSPTAAGEAHAVLWKDGELHDLGAFGRESAVAVAIDAAGRVLVSAGHAPFGTVTDKTAAVFLVEGENVTEVTRPEYPSRAFDMNDRGVIVGESRGRAVVWEGGRMRELPVPPGCPERKPLEPIVTLPDRDRDGVPEEQDACPATAPGVVVDETGCARDTDGDYVPDGLDRCPDTKRGTMVGENGCPIEEGTPSSP